MMTHRRWWLITLLAMYAWSLGGARATQAQERPPRFLFATKVGLVPLDIEHTPTLMRRISPAMDGVPLRAALLEITAASGVQFGFDDHDFPETRRVRLVADAITVAAALTEVLLGTGLDVVYNRDGRVVLVKRGMTYTSGLPQQTGTLTGRVAEQGTNAPVVSAQVLIVDMKRSVYTDDRGRYRVTDVLVGEHGVAVRRLGFVAVTRRVRVGDGETVTLDVAMDKAPTALMEVVTTATGERSRLEVGNAIGTIKADSLVPTTLIRNFSDLLTARTPGVIVSVGDGSVGSPSKIRIRGVNSIYLNNDPIIILDGVRLASLVTRAASQMNVGSATMVSVGGTGGPALIPSPLDDIDPNIIESIDVLRGPSAATLYGTEAANGVIVIKTKQGTAGPFRFNLMADNGWSRLPGRMPDYWLGWSSGPVFIIDGSCSLFAGTSNVTNGGCVQDSVTHFNTVNNPRLTTLGTGTARNLSANMSGGTVQLKEFLSIRSSDNVGISKLSDAEQSRLTRMWGVSPRPGWCVRIPNRISTDPRERIFR